MADERARAESTLADSPPLASERIARVVGTAGHVDHGKSTLIRALTGIDPDRLREEQERGMTIDLGFAWLRLPSGQEISIVDVPGHERFIHNMLAGVGGIDIALLVIAADEGIMPQTREHLAILDLLDIRDGVVVITKADLVDQEWLDLVQAEVEDGLQGTTLAGAPMIAVSAVTRRGFDDLLGLLDSALGRERSRARTGVARLPVDRVFTVAGFGTVVTGTLVDGELRVGQELEIQPAGLRARIRGLQSHKRKVEAAPSGSRVAVNLTGVSPEHLERGQVLASPGSLRATQIVDARLRLLKDVPRPFAHNTQVTFHSGTAETSARVGLLDQTALQPGHSGWVQIRLAQPLALARGDLFIVRLPSPSLTLGGGTVVEPHPRRHRRFQQPVLERLAVLERGTPEEVLLQQLRTREPVDLDALSKRAGATTSDLSPLVASMAERGEVLVLGGDSKLGPRSLLVSRAGWENLRGRAGAEMRGFHTAQPLRLGLQKEELRGRLGLEPRAFARVLPALVAAGELAEDGPLVRSPGHEVRLSPEQERKVQALFELLAQGGASPPGPPELEAQVGLAPEVVQVLIERGDLVEVGADLVYARPTIDAIEGRIVAAIRESGKLTVAEVRDLFGTSRRYALALLGYLDDRKVTRRVGDERVLY